MRRDAARRSRTTATCSPRDPDYAERAEQISVRAKDVSEFLAEPRHRRAEALVEPEGRLSCRVLAAARPARHVAAEGAVEESRLRCARYRRRSFVLRLCRRSTTSYSRKLPVTCATARPATLKRCGPTLSPPATSAASPNCNPALDCPVVHTVELLDWAYGGPVPPGLEALQRFSTPVPQPARSR